MLGAWLNQHYYPLSMNPHATTFNASEHHRISLLSFIVMATVTVGLGAYALLLLYRQRQRQKVTRNVTLRSDGSVKRSNGDSRLERRRKKEKEKEKEKEQERLIAEHLEKVRRVAASQRQRREAEREKARDKPPELEELGRLVATLLDPSTGTCHWGKLIAIGDVYHRGSFPRFLPNPDVAMQCYKVAAMSPVGRYAGMAQTKYMEARMNPIPIEDQRGAQIPEHFGRHACALAYDVFANTPVSMFETPKGCKKRENDGEDVVDVEDEVDAIGANAFDGIDPALQVLLIDDAEREQERRRRLHLHLTAGREARAANDRPGSNRHRTIAAFKHDSQNVHDHGISSTTDFNLRQLQTDRNQINTQRQIEEKRKDVRKGILACKDVLPWQREDALHVLNNLSHHTHSTYDTSELAALTSVWDKIEESEHRENLVETLAKQLASGIERGSTVCSSGKIARIVSTLDGATNQAAPRPMWAIREEIGTLAGKVRDDMGEAASEDALKHEFGRRVRDEYIQKLGLSSSIMEPMIEEYSAGY